MARGIECFRVLFPRGMDANAFSLKVTPAVQSLGLVLRQAVWMGKGVAPVMAEAAAAEASELAPERTNAALSEPEPLHAEPLPAPPLPPAADEPPRPPATPEPKSTPQPVAPPPPASARRPSAAEVSFLAAELGAAVVTTPLVSPPAAKPAATAAEPRSSAEELIFQFGDRRWRIRGFSKNTSAEQLKINALVSREGGGFHVENWSCTRRGSAGCFRSWRRTSWVSRRA